MEPNTKHAAKTEPICLTTTMQKTVSFLLFCLFLAVAVPRLLSLEAHWSSDEARWLRRSAQFMDTVKAGQFSDTVIAYHPGVTTMWVAGLRTFFTDARVNLKNLALARWFIGISILAGIGISCLLLYRLFGKWVALVSCASLTYSPLLLAQTRRVHTDALATIFIGLTVLLFLCYCQNRHLRRYLICSGITFGLALLTKSYALILLLWIPICLFLFSKKRNTGLLTHVAEVICFLNTAALTCIALWPVFWTLSLRIMALCLFGLTLMLFKAIPREQRLIWNVSVALAALLFVSIRATQTIWLVFDKVQWALTTPHEVEHFFLGKVVHDPGWLFYPFVLTIKSTPLMLPLALLAGLLLWKYRNRTNETAYQLRIALALALAALLFTVCLSATNKKFSRYLLPAFLMLEILAAIGFVEGLKWSYAALQARFGTEQTKRYKAALAVSVCLCFFLIQMLPVLTLHPYYGTYYNLCWKITDITKIITVGEASGLDIAATYLNQKNKTYIPGVQVSPLSAEFIRHYLRGFAYRADRGTGRTADYEVVYIRDSQIGRVPQTGTRNGDLEAVITLNGIDHVWIYRTPDTVEAEK